MGIIIDTSALIQLERQKRLTLPPEHGMDYFLPTVVWSEISVGMRMANSSARAAERRRILEDLLWDVEFLDFDRHVAEHCADITAELLRGGKRIPQNDAAVAATARAYGHAVLIGQADEQHYRLVNGLEIVVLPSA